MGNKSLYEIFSIYKIDSLSHCLLKQTVSFVDLYFLYTYHIRLRNKNKHDNFVTWDNQDISSRCTFVSK